MKINADISQMQWRYIALESIPNEEQEVHFNVDKHNQVVYVACSYQKWITRLLALKPFVVESMLVNSALKQRADKLSHKFLEVKGTLPLWALALRSKQLSGSKKQVGSVTLEGGRE